jgi:hypothetical protein
LSSFFHPSPKPKSVTNYRNQPKAKTGNGLPKSALSQNRQQITENSLKPKSVKDYRNQPWAKIGKGITIL